MSHAILEPSQDDRPARRLDRRAFLKLALSGACLLAAPGLGFDRVLAAGPDCGDGAPESFTAAAAGRQGMFVVFSDVHFDPFADPSKVKALAGAPATAWGDILADPAQGFAPYGQDTDNALFLAFLDDMARRAPNPDFLLFPGDMLCHRFWATYPRLTGDASPAGLLAFIAKTATYFFSEVARRFPGCPVFAALGNNDSVEGDYRIAPDSPYLAVTAPLLAQLSQAQGAQRQAFMETYPRYGCYALPLPGREDARLVVLNDIFWTKRSPQTAGARPVLDFLERELAMAARRGERVWLMTHVPPGDNPRSSSRDYLKTGDTRYAPLLLDAYNDALLRRLNEHAATVKAAFAGHVHRDAFRLFYGANAGLPSGNMRLVPSISPITGNNPGYHVYAYDRDSLELLDVQVPYADLGAAQPAWELEYVYSKAYGRGLRAPADWQAMYRQLRDCPARGQAFAAAFDLRSRRIDEITPQTFPIYWRALGLASQASFTAGAPL
ncbi:MAG: metallophosphoesterase [Solidesulfovibrio sp. DCME]|uniref:metallophosphoesterase n=1 Tax=Solidesulfovibrio sp. DCME TaxID=3447380 RepID=UPI003D12989D